MAITPRSISSGATSQDAQHGSAVPSHALDASVAGTYPINTDISGSLTAGQTITGANRAKVASTDVVVEAAASHPCSLVFADSPDGTTFTDRATLSLIGGRVRTGWRCVITTGTHYRLRAVAPAGSDGGVSLISVYSQQRP